MAEEEGRAAFRLDIRNRSITYFVNDFMKRTQLCGDSDIDRFTLEHVIEAMIWLNKHMGQLERLENKGTRYIASNKADQNGRHVLITF